MAISLIIFALKSIVFGIHQHIILLIYKDGYQIPKFKLEMETIIIKILEIKKS
jgi:hypothetical protein